MNKQEMELMIVLAELEHANKQISGFMGLQMRVLAVVATLLGATIGLVFAAGPANLISGQTLAKLLIVISSVGSFGVMQSIINYGIALGYIYSKNNVLSPRLCDLLELEKSPIQAIQAFQESPARTPVYLATLVVAVGIFLLNATVLVYAWNVAVSGSWTQLMVMPAASILVLTVFCQYKTAIAMQAIGITGDRKALSSD